MTENLKIKIFGVPMDLGAYRVGVDMGPNALRYAGLIRCIQKLGIEIVDIGNLPVPTPESRTSGRKNLKYRDEIAKVSEELAQSTQDTLKGGYFPLILGGDHSIAIGSISGVSSMFKGKFGVVWIDAHPDCNTPDTTLSGNIHGMSLAVVLGHGDGRLVNCHTPGAKLDPSNICIVGAKDFDREEKKFIADNKIKLFTIDDISDIGIKDMMKEIRKHFAGLDGIFVSLDLDVIDVAFAPGIGIRSHGGLTYREIRHLCRSLCKSFNILGMELVEFNPIFDRDNQTANLAIELVFDILGHEYGDYQRYLELQTN